MLLVPLFYSSYNYKLFFLRFQSTFVLWEFKPITLCSAVSNYICLFMTAFHIFEYCYHVPHSSLSLQAKQTYSLHSKLSCMACIPTPVIFVACLWLLYIQSSN